MPLRIGISVCPRTGPAAEPIPASLGGATIFEEGRLLEAAIRAGEIDAVIEVSLTDLAAELLGTGFGAGPDRLTAASLAGVPQVVVLGGLDGARADQLEFVRTTPDQNDRLGQEIAFKLSASRGPVAIVMPRGGLSVLDVPGGPFWNPAADAALFQSVRNWISPDVEVIEIDAHVCDEACAAAVVAAFRATINRPKR